MDAPVISCFIALRCCFAAANDLIELAAKKKVAIAEAQVSPTKVAWTFGLLKRSTVVNTITDESSVPKLIPKKAKCMELVFPEANSPSISA
jgi:hypothetical protein